jgi:hypothetical protein
LPGALYLGVFEQPVSNALFSNFLIWVGGARDGNHVYPARLGSFASFGNLNLFRASEFEFRISPEGGLMAKKIALKKIDKKIQSMKKTAEELKEMAEGFPALARNTTRILASIKMLELNVSDLVETEVAR